MKNGKYILTDFIKELYGVLDVVSYNMKNEVESLY